MKNHLTLSNKINSPKLQNMNNIIQSRSSPLSLKDNNEDILIKDLRQMTAPANLSQHKVVELLFKRLRGTHIPVNYRPEYQFSERWQQQSKSKQTDSESSQFSNSNLINGIRFIIMMHQWLLLWYLTIHRFFEFAQNCKILECAIGFNCIDLIISFYMIKQQFDKYDGPDNYYWIELVIEKCFNKCLSLLCVIIIYAFHQNELSLLIFIDFLCIYLVRLRFTKIYSHLTITFVPQNYRHYISITDFLFKLITIIHISAIILHAITYIKPYDNWLQSIGKQNQSSFSKYILSFYFASSTLATVGYGDILPTNNLERIIIILIQIIGIITLGYIINEIGRSLSQLRQAQETFQRDLIKSQKIGNYYHLPYQIKARVRNYIANNKQANETFDIHDQQNFLMKLSQNLRNQVKEQNHINIVKTSLFFICNWSKRVHVQTAKKLTSIMAMPGEKMMKDNKIYLINRGGFDLFTERRGAIKMHCCRHLKVLRKKETDEVHHNAFGYTSFYTGKPSKLFAIAKQFSICYVIEYADLMEFIRDSDQDFQHYHHIHAKLQMQKFPEKIQCPQMINNRQNFYPMQYFVLKRNFKHSKYQKRRKCFRSKRHTKIELNDKLDNKFYMQQTVNQLKMAEQTQNASSGSCHQDTFNENSCSSNIGNTKIVSTKQIPQNFINRTLRRKLCKMNLIQQKAKQQIAQIHIRDYLIETSLFEIGKLYHRYYPKNNWNKVISQMKKVRGDLEVSRGITQFSITNHTQRSILTPLSKTLQKTFIG